MRSDAKPFVVGQIRGVSSALHGAELRLPSRPPSTFQTVSLERLSGKSLVVCLAGLLGRRNGPLRPTFVAAKRSSDAPEHRPGDFPDSLWKRNSPKFVSTEF